MSIQQKTISAIRALSVSAIEKSGSGHPGLPLGAAAIGYELFANQLKYNPYNPDFFNRDRFILSAGHGTMLLYSLLHLFGFDVTIEDIKNFRQLGSVTPGHPEKDITDGVDVSTGPLGQGIANAVGLALAEAYLSTKFNREGFDVVDHYTFALCGEGCLMEGISYEASSLAGTLKLGKLIVLYDANRITIEGDIDIAFDENIALRHEALGWEILRVENGNDIWEIGQAIEKAKSEKNKPSLIIINTKIGYCSPKEGCASCHGAPLGQENAKKTFEKMGWEYKPFEIPSEIYAHCEKTASKGQLEEHKWNSMLVEYTKKYPDLAKELTDSILNKVNIDFSSLYEFEDKPIAIRKASSIILNKIATDCNFFLGGSADLGPSNLTLLENEGDFSSSNRLGRNIHFGIREHAMSAICNGMALHKGVLPYCSTFFSFSDYMKNAVRMSAIMRLRVIYVFTHDSIGVGEDGPTHQPIEHLAGLRAMPELKLFRPADAVETASAYEFALKYNGPTAIVCAKQDLPIITKKENKDNILRGAYIAYDCPDFEAILLSSGSEVNLCIESAKELKEQGINVRVVSMPCHSLFDEQDEQYKNEILPLNVRNRIAVEAGSKMPYGKYVGLDGDYICIDRFGESAKASDLFNKFGFTKENIINKVRNLVKK